MRVKKNILKNLFINKETFYFMSVKEITHWCNNTSKEIAYVVKSGDCKYPEDAHTNIGREVINSTIFYSYYRMATREDYESFYKKLKE